MIFGFGGANLLLSPIRGSALRAAAFAAPVTYGALFVFEWPLAIGIAFSLLFAVWAFGMIYSAARISARHMAAGAGAPLLESPAGFALVDGEPGQVRPFVTFASFAAVGVVIQVPALSAAVARGAWNEVPHQISWIVCCAVVWSIACTARARRLARVLHTWFEADSPGALRGVVRDGGEWTPATLTFDGKAVVVLATPAGNFVLGGAQSDYRPGPAWRIGRQSVAITIGDREVQFSPVGASDPARWPHYASTPKWLGRAPSPMWELITQLQYRSPE